MQKTKILNHGSFSFRVFICIFTTSFFLLVIGSLVLYSISVHETKRISGQMFNDTLSVIAANIDHSLDSIQETSQTAFAQENILTLLKKRYSAHSASYLSIQHALVTAVSANNAVCHISLIDPWGNTISTSSPSFGTASLPYDTADSCLAYFNTYSDPVNINNQIWYFNAPHLIQKNQYCIVNIREIVLKPVIDECPLLIISISEDALTELYRYAGNQSYIVLNNGTIISAIDKKLIGTKLDAETMDKIRKCDSSGQYEGSGMVWTVAPLSVLPAYLVVGSDEITAVSSQKTILFSAIITIVIGLLLSFFWSRYIASTLTSPIKKAKAIIEQIHDDNLSVRCEVVRQDEVGYLCESFNHMMDKLVIQIEKNNEQQRLAKESELRLLQSQINPHLLYNSLDSAVYMISKGDTELSIKTLAELSSYFKLALQKGSKVVPVQKSLEHISSYLKLQNLCRLKKYTLVTDIDDSLRDRPLLHMLLQPIVENSVLHGFEGSFDDGEINIRIIEHDSFMYINIKDNGCGIDWETLQKLRNTVSSSSSPSLGYGMWNVAERMRMYYGEDSHIFIDSEVGEYTSVTLRIPLENK